MNHYEIYPGGKIKGEIIIAIDKDPDVNGNVLLTLDEYDAGFGHNLTRHNSPDRFTSYNVVIADNGRVVLHTLPWDHPTVQSLLTDDYDLAAIDSIYKETVENDLFTEEDPITE